jgi:hypothetical protein
MLLYFFIDKPDSCHYLDLKIMIMIIDSIKYWAVSKKEAIMVEVTKQATEQVQEYFKDRDLSPIRIFLNEGG